MNGTAPDTGDEPAVRITWSEVRRYEAVIPLSRLTEAVESYGDLSDGHPMPADLSELEGDPFAHGNLNWLLADLEDDHLAETSAIEVSHVQAWPASLPYGSTSS